jgi:hypothetical protein
MDDEIYSIPIGIEFLDDDYIFFSSGKVLRYTNNRNANLIQKNWIDPCNIKQELKAILLKKCPTKHKEQITNLLTSGR